MKRYCLPILFIISCTSCSCSSLAFSSGLFSRRGYNIESITAGVTANPRYSRITIIASGDDDILEQIERQVEKLVDVRSIKVLEPKDSVYRELCLIKVEVTDQTREGLISISNIFRANIIDVSENSMIVELTGNQSKIEAFLGLLSGYTILELARTGLTGLSRGNADVVWLDD